LDVSGFEEDRADVAASLRGDGRAYARIVERYESAVFSQMTRFTRDPLVLEELVQDVFVEAYGSLDKFRFRAPLLHWVRRIATRVGYHYWKQAARTRWRRERLEGWRENAAWMQPVGTKTPSEAAQRLFEMLSALSPKDRLVLTLYYFDECDANEIAARTGWSVTLVRVRVHRALKRLRQILEAAGPKEVWL
jgi:RNA polymerase sigma-70 factor (ECF subfamily)